MPQSKHRQELTALSITETLFDGRAPAEEDSIGNKVGLENIETTLSPLVQKRRQVPEKGLKMGPYNYPPVIPPTHPNRTIVLCFDGTGDQFDDDNSNVVQLVSLLKKDDRSKQMVYYQTLTLRKTGIGTYTSPKIATPIRAGTQKILDKMFASGIHAHVMGFSRGAYTARSLAGMLHKVGLLPPFNAEQIPFAYRMYQNKDKEGWDQSNAFKDAFSINVDIEFLGVWDTVDSIGVIPSKPAPFALSNSLIKTFRHAVSLDERRAKFKANLWHYPTEDEAKLGLPVPSETNYDEAEDEKFLNDDEAQSILERTHSQMNEKGTDILEVWFAGCHCDVGGGSVSNKERHSLARIPLRWMVREIFKANTGMLFISEKLFAIGMHPSTLFPLVLPRPDPLPVGDHKIRMHPKKEIPIRQPSKSILWWRNKGLTRGDVCKPHERGVNTFLGSEEEEELMDALSPEYDQLKRSRWWVILEYVPLHLRWEGDHGLVEKYGWNRKAPRYIRRQDTDGVQIHRSVQLRMQAAYESPVKQGKPRKNLKYKHRAPIHENVKLTWADLDKPTAL
ncbi:hypothetical protein D9611_009030 [Ephemerocybe angulata]|uniref:T6SS Phospholipase effector Tle1-like catalytic domain-containing protein n=1 Tax=Ephemerocybe angulata TaxID=980116 RepID=A0A8H5CE21_9AGAR|nr:hypothetical protein D9611_009030 [Tulosesus angulatus]